MKRKNTNYQTIDTGTQLNNSWNTTNSWIDHTKFKENFYGDGRKCGFFKGSYVYDHPNVVGDNGFGKGDVVQFSMFYNGFIQESFFTSYVTFEDIGIFNNTRYKELFTTYTNNTNKSVRNLSNTYKEYYIVLYDF